MLFKINSMSGRIPIYSKITRKKILQERVLIFPAESRFTYNKISKKGDPDYEQYWRVQIPFNLRNNLKDRLHNLIIHESYITYNEEVEGYGIEIETINDLIELYANVGDIIFQGDSFLICDGYLE